MPDKATDALNISRTVRIPIREFRFETARSGGPGGQNVNKVNSKVRLRWPVTTSSALPEEARRRLLDRQAGRLTTEGELIVTSQRFRDQRRNHQDCLDRLRAIVLESLPTPKRRRATKPSGASQRRRVEAKRRRSRTKRLRRRPTRDD